MNSKINFKIMKTLYAFIIFSMLTFEYKGQANLVFNQVLSNAFVISGNPSTGSTGIFTVNAPLNYTVPTNKAWKIESINSFTETPWSNITYGGTSVKLKIKINNILVFVSNSNTDLNSPNIITDNAIWLKAGDVLSFTVSGSGYSYNNYSGATNIHYSIIEYNIVP